MTKLQPKSHDSSPDSPAAGKEPGFVTTSWSVVHAAGDTDPTRARAALTTLLERYRGPVTAYLLHEGYSESEAVALVGQFFNELGRTGALRSASSFTGPFRKWLIEALEEFLSTDPDPNSPPPPSRPSSPAQESAARPVVPGYQVLERIDEGGEGLVYRAYDDRAQRQVALKILRPEYVSDAERVERFRKSVALASTLDHPNIVRVYDMGSPTDAAPHYAMQLIVGGTLAERQRQDRFRDPERAARLVIKIARAIHHAHQHGILHRDLSPANILLDVHDEPFVTDFMAKRIRQSGPHSVVGKFAYAAPERGLGEGDRVEADIYALGAILYELWTGNPPIRANSFSDVAVAHAQGGPKAPRELVPDIPHELELICLSALSRDPADRHASAAVFADSLERSLANFPPLWPKISRRRRAWLWARRHPLLAVNAVLGAVLLMMANWLTLASVRAQQAELESATLNANAALASAQARAVLALFEKFSTQASRAAADPEVRQFLERAEVGSGVPILAKLIGRARSFDSIALFSADGRMLAREPEPQPELLGREYRFRDYYHCIQALAQKARHAVALREEPEVCVSPAYRGENSGRIEFTVGAPVYGPNGFVGFVILNKHAKNTVEEVEIDDMYGSGQTTAVFGQRGLDRDSVPSSSHGPRRLTAVAHSRLFSDEERALDPELSRRIIQRFGGLGAPGLQVRPMRVRPLEEPNYIDPVTGEQRLAGFAPVGQTGFVVSVSTPRARALEASERHIAALWRYAAMLNLGFLILAGVALRASLRDIPPDSRGSRGPA